MGCAAQAACPQGTIETGNGCQLVEIDTAFPRLGLDAETEPMDVQPVPDDTQTADTATDSTTTPQDGDTTTTVSDIMEQTDTLEPGDIVPTEDSSSGSDLDVLTDIVPTDETNG